MGKDPAVLFYHQDFLLGTEFMEDSDVGKYIRLLCHQFDKGKLTKKQVLSICKASAIEKIEPEIMSKLKKDNDGLYYNQRAMEEKEKRVRFTESRRQNALGKKKPKASATASAKHMEDRDRDVIEYNNVLINIEFEIFWNLYDKKVSKPKTELLWAKLNDKERELIIDYIPKYKRSQPDKAYRKNPDVFLRNRAWEDEIVTKQPEDGRGVRRTHAPISDERKKEYSEL